ncbi:hypothetical protein [Glutamicibacter sp. X7]
MMIRNLPDQTKAAVACGLSLAGLLWALFASLLLPVPEALELIAPMGIWTALWFVVLGTAAAYSLWQARSGVCGEDLHRQIRTPVVLACLLQGLWIQFWPVGTVLVELGVLLGQSLLLVWILYTIDHAELPDRADRWMTRVTFGLWGGWLVAILLMTAVAYGVELGFEINEPTFKIVVSLVVLLSALALCALSFRNPVGIYLNVAALWSVCWVAVERYVSAHEASLVAVVCSIAAGLMFLCLLLALRQRLSLKFAAPADSNGTSQGDT